VQIVKRKCIDCGHVGLIAYCPSCRGKAGGSKTTPRKRRASRANVKKALAARIEQR